MVHTTPTERDIMTTATTTKTTSPVKAVQGELLRTLHTLDTLHARDKAGEDVGGALRDACDRSDTLRVLLASMTGEPLSPSVQARIDGRRAHAAAH